MLYYLVFSNKFSALNKRTLVGMLLGVYFCSTVVWLCSAYAQQAYVDQGAIDNLQITKRCMSAREGALASGGAALEKFNLECNHQQMLREGNNLMQVYRAHAAQRASDAAKAAKSASIDDLISDGTCLESDRQAGVAECINRQNRTKLDADIQAREAYLKHQKQRIELLDEDGKPSLLGVQKKGGKQDTVLKDLYNQSRIQKNAAGVKQPRYWTPGVRSVEFGKSEPKVGSSTLEVTDKSFNAVGKADVGSINKGVANEYFDGSVAETVGSAPDAKIDSLLKLKKTDIERKVRSDQLLYSKEADRLDALQKKSSTPATPKPTKVGVSEQAFERLMDSVATDASQDMLKKGETVTGNAIDTYNVSVKTEDPTLAAPRSPSASQSNGSPSTRTQDQIILDDLTNTF